MLELDFLDSLSSLDARFVAVCHYLERTELDYKFLEFCLTLGQKLEKFYHCGMICSKMSSFYKDNYSQEYIKSETTQTSFAYLKLHRNSSINTFRKYFFYLNKAGAFYEKEGLFAFSANSFKSVAIDVFKMAQKLEEQSKLLKGKSLSLKSNYSRYAAKFNKKKSMLSLKESWEIKEKAIKFLENAEKLFSLANMLGEASQVVKTIKTFKLDLIASKKNHKKAMKMALKYKRLDLAAVYAEKINNHNLAKEYQMLHDKCINDFKLNAQQNEGKAKQICKEIKKIETQIDFYHKKMKRLDNQRLFASFFSTSYSFRLYRLKRKLRILSAQSKQYFSHAMKLYLEAEMYGKAHSIEKHIENILPHIENLIISLEKALLKSDISLIYQINSDLDQYIIKIKELKRFDVLQVLLRKKKSLVDIIKKTQQADKLEMESENLEDSSKQNHILHKTMLLYEGIGFFKMAREIANKLKDNEKRALYQKCE